MTPVELSDFNRKLEELIEQVQHSKAPAAPVGFVGEQPAPKLEHNVRRRFLDLLLNILGWKIDFNVVEEARVRGQETLFLDYLGVHVDERIPLMIFEAKAGDKPFVTGTTAALKRLQKPELIALALKHIKENKTTDAPLIAGWMKWLRQLHDYVNKLKDQSGHIVSRVAIGTEDWLVIFTDPASAFVDKIDVSTDKIVVIGAKDFLAQAHEIFRNLAYGELVQIIPRPMVPTQLSAFISANAVRRVFQALFISWRKSGFHALDDTYPQILVHPAVVIERSDGVLLHLADKRHGRFDLSPSPKFLADHFEEISQKFDELLRAIFGELGQAFQMARIDDFPGFPPTPGISFQGPLFLHPLDRPGEFLLATGNSQHFILERPNVAACLGHDWASCRDAGHPAAFHVETSSYELKSFFESEMEHHCAHSTIHNRRVSRCHIKPFEDYLCCQACIFTDLCWSAGSTPPMPCGCTVDEFQNMLKAAAN